MILPYAIAMMLVSNFDDEALRKPLTRHGNRRPVSESLEAIAETTDRRIILGAHVPDEHLFLAARGVRSDFVMDGVSSSLSNSRYKYDWHRSGRTTYFLSRVPRDERQLASEARHRLNTILGQLPPYRPSKNLSANSAIPARYELIRSLPASIRERSISTALSGKRVILPVNLFNRNTLVEATGGVEVVGGPLKLIRFSWREIAAGRGYVALQRTRLRDGNFGLKINIGTGDIPPEGSPISGPVLDLIDHPNRMRERTYRVEGAARRDSSNAPSRGTATLVTILNDNPLSKGETPLENVLRQLAQEGNVATVGKWPSNYKQARLRLPDDLIKMPLDEAAKRIANFYKLKLILKKPVVALVSH